jgi:hypothetical protein
LPDRYHQHLKPSQPVGKHAYKCGVLMEICLQDNVEILAQSSRSCQFLETLEALWQDELRPTINTKEEWRSRELTIKL